jgi:hypothetical protein
MKFAACLKHGQKKLDIAFDHKKTVGEAFSSLRNQWLCYDNGALNVSFIF